MLIFLLIAQLTLPPSVHLHISNLREARGSVYVAVFNRPEGFLEEKYMIVQKVVPVQASGSLQLDLADLPPGAYAVSCFHDVNGNGRIDKNLMGVPTEPYGFSNNARPKFRAPTWEESRFEVGRSGAAISIRLEKW